MALGNNFLKNLCQWNWQTPIVPRRWLRWLYRREFIRSRAQGVSLPFECDFFGFRYAGDICNTIDFHCFFYGAFEKGHLFFWRDVAQKHFGGQGVFLDIGANVGQHSLFMARHCATVHAFEPFEPVRRKIIEKVELNDLTNLIVHTVGLGDKEQRLPFHPPSGANLGVGSFVDGQQDRCKATETLQVVNGDEYFSRHIGGEVHMVKMDVEGFEKKAMAGFGNTFAKNRPVIVVEMTKGLEHSFKSGNDVQCAFPAEYDLYVFDLAGQDGRKDKRKDAAFRKKGTYRLAPFEFDKVEEQTDVIGFPRELCMQNAGVHR